MRNRAGASFMTRLGRDVRGNVIAISAAALIPLAGLIGGGVDMSRLYLTKTRLQQACDAGVLAGRRAMGSGSWTEEGSTSTRSRALELFNANFTDGAYGTTLLDHDFSEDDGEVTGFADVSVPMTIMRIFGITERTMHVTCTAKMEIPNTDVMFVLDVTGSMAGTRIAGLKSAVKCFYEALLRVNTTQVCGNDPTATSYTGTAQIRLGFMPYSVNVNVGKLLNNDWIANTWNYQSRVGVNNLVWTWTLGDPTTPNYGTWRPSISDLGNFSGTSGYESFSGPVSNNKYTLADGVDYPKRDTTVYDSNQCSALNRFAGGTQILGVQLSSGFSSPSADTYTPTNNNPPVYPAATQDQQARQTRTATASTGFRYRWFKSGGTTGCWLESAAKRNGWGHTNTYTEERVGPSSRTINWVAQNRVTWTYKQLQLDVSGLKAGGANWNNSISLPIGTTTTPAALSGSSGSTNIDAMTNTDVVWDGCIEERQTVKNSDGDPSDEWSPVPAEAWDLSIDMIPDAGTNGSQWGPMLPDAVWGRYTGTSTNNRTLANVETLSNLNRNNSYYCATEAKKLQTWNTPSGFEGYVNSLTPNGNTFHDIGLIWGARFISPTGIFADENRETPTGGAIQRHIIFMTDGEAQAANTNYTAHGIPWWDRRQTTYAPDSATLQNIINSRLVALCTAIRNRNITLWVVSYGGGVNSTTEARLKNCATPGKYFKADDAPTLISNFKQIASEIADLRLTN